MKFGHLLGGTLDRSLPDVFSSPPLHVAACSFFSTHQGDDCLRGEISEAIEQELVVENSLEQ
jgi:hypothetical protein